MNACVEIRIGDILPNKSGRKAGGEMLGFVSRLPLLVPLIVSFLLGSVECRAQSTTAETLSPPILPANTSVVLRLKKDLYKKDAKPGQPVEFEVAIDVIVTGQVLIQSGATVSGSIREINKAKVLIDLGPAQTVSGEMVRLTGPGTTKDDPRLGKPTLKDVGGIVLVEPRLLPLLPVIMPVIGVMQLLPGKILLHKAAGCRWFGEERCGMWVVAHVAENVALDPAKQKVAQAQYTAKQRAAEVEFCRLLKSRNPESSPYENDFFDFFFTFTTPFKAQLLHKAGDLDAAIEEYQQALALKPDCPELRVLLHVLLEGVFEEKGDFAQAIEEVQQALALKPDFPRLHVLLAKLFQKKGDFVHAIPEYRTAVQLDPKDEHTREGFVTFLVESDDPDAALAEIKQAMRIWPDNIYFHYLLGRLLVKKNDPDAAIVELQWVLKQEKNHDWKASCALGSAYELKGDLKAALGQYRTAYRVHMDDKECRAAYERLRLQLKK